MRSVEVHRKLTAVKNVKTHFTKNFHSKTMFLGGFFFNSTARGKKPPAERHNACNFNFYKYDFTYQRN